MTHISSLATECMPASLSKQQAGSTSLKLHACLFENPLVVMYIRPEPHQHGVSGPRSIHPCSMHHHAGIVIHMDDSEPSVQEAAAAALEALAAKKPVAVRDEVLKVRYEE
jgi:hypothetical protein